MNSTLLAYLALGLVGGAFAGFFGVGGGIILIPGLLWIFGHSQHTAQGMSLAALVLPVGILGAWAYYRTNPYPIKPALMISLGLFIGGWVGGVLAQQVPGKTLKILFGLLMIFSGIKLVVGK